MAVNSTLVLAVLPLFLWYLYSLAVKWRFGGKREGLVYAPTSLFFGAGKAIAGLYRARGDMRLHSG